MGRKRIFSLYDMEQFIRDAGAERVNEKAVLSFEQELESTLNELLSEAEKYANYAGRRRLIKGSDIRLLVARRAKARQVYGLHGRQQRSSAVGVASKQPTEL